MQDKLVTYVYGDKEVYLTGRVATPQDGVIQSITMVEIVPIGTEVGDMMYAKWVNVADLLVIKNLEEQEFNDET